MENLREWLNGKRDYASGVKLYNQLGADPALKRMFSEPESDFKRKKLIKALEDIWQVQKQGKIPVISHPQAKPSPAPVPFKIKRELVKTKTEVKTLASELSELQNQVSDQESTIEDQQQTIEDLEWEKVELEDENDELVKKLKTIKSRNGWPIQMDEAVASLHAQWKLKFLTMVDLQSRLFEVASEGRTNKSKEKQAGTMALQILDLREEIIGIYHKRDHYLVNGELPEVPPAVEECLDPLLWPKKLDNAQRYVRTYRGKLDKLSETDNKYLLTLQQLQKWEAEVIKYKNFLKLD
jgi:chromosome segregation ATPase